MHKHENCREERVSFHLLPQVMSAILEIFPLSTIFLFNSPITEVYFAFDPLLESCRVKEELINLTQVNVCIICKLKIHTFTYTFCISFSFVA